MSAPLHSSSVPSQSPPQQQILGETCYIGCFLDNLTYPALPRNIKQYSSPPFTVATCQALALQRNVTFFAIKNGTE
jgi:hypothetical protein